MAKSFVMLVHAVPMSLMPIDKFDPLAECRPFHFPPTLAKPGPE